MAVADGRPMQGSGDAALAEVLEAAGAAIDPERTAMIEDALEREEDLHGRILLVDDEDVVRRTGALLLESLGYEVVTAHNGREGVELFSIQHGQLDLVLLDMIMPEMNGHDAFWAMRRIDARVPIVVCSGYAGDEAVRGLRDRGLAAFLPKPYRRAELAEVVGHARRRTD